MPTSKSMALTGSGTRLSSPASGVDGNSSVTTMTPTVASSKFRLGGLLKNGLLVLITRTISEAEMIDYMNHPVRN